MLPGATAAAPGTLNCCTTAKQRWQPALRLRSFRSCADGLEHGGRPAAEIVAAVAPTEPARSFRRRQQATACRGALDGFIAEVIEDHIMEHLVDPSAKQGDARSQAVEELVEIIHSYLT